MAQSAILPPPAPIYTQENFQRGQSAGEGDSMRRKVPEHISKLADLIAPYLVLDQKTKQYVLLDNVPEDIVKAKQIYDAWFEDKANCL